jgi:uncharacterized protein YbcV (DUF1398 family)
MQQTVIDQVLAAIQQPSHACKAKDLPWAATNLGEPKNVVHKQQHVLTLNITEILCNCETCRVKGSRTSSSKVQTAANKVQAKVSVQSHVVFQASHHVALQTKCLQPPHALICMQGEEPSPMLLLQNQSQVADITIARVVNTCSCTTRQSLLLLQS